ncbi:MAG: rod shape-determining protein MreD [Acidimicrobiales bacterium]|jgi:rod shape-determining protein MreD|nr:rod shape-determining protein MreD [Acidimicrobiales bacterium]
MNQPRLKVPLVLLVALVLHTAVMGHLRLAGVAPDLMVLIPIVGGLTSGPERGAALGFFCGLAVDLVVQTTPLGLSALAFSIIGYTVGVLEAGILRSSWWIPPATALFASAAGEALYAVSGALVGQTQLVTDRLATIVVVVGVLNAVFALPMLRIVRWSMRDGSAANARYV